MRYAARACARWRAVPRHARTRRVDSAAACAARAHACAARRNRLYAQAELVKLGDVLDAELRWAIDATEAAALAARRPRSRAGADARGASSPLGSKREFTVGRAHIERARAQLRAHLRSATRALSERLHADAHSAHGAAPAAPPANGAAPAGAGHAAREVTAALASAAAKRAPIGGASSGVERLSSLVWLRCHTCELHASHVFTFDDHDWDGRADEVPQVWCSCSARVGAPLPLKPQPRSQPKAQLLPHGGSGSGRPSSAQMTAATGPPPGLSGERRR